MIKKVFFLLLLLTVVIIITFFAIKHNNSELHTQSLTFKIETYETKYGGWGYNIIEGNKIFIKQEIIPAISNNISFQSENDAKKIGLLMIKKLNENKIPTIKTEELKQLEIDIKE